MKVSVVMATYNSLNYIGKQLDSIRNQSRKVDEVIFVDDCSKDETPNFLESYIKKYSLKNWKIYVNKENLGFINTFRTAISKATGDIIILSDHDDIWLPNKCEIIVKAFNDNRSILSLNTKFKKIDENDELINIKESIFKSNNGLIRRRIKKGSLNKMSLKDTCIYNISPGCTCAISNELVKIYLRYSYDIPHDLELNILAACYSGLYYLDIPTTLYRIYSGNTIGLNHQNKYEIRKKVVEHDLHEKELIALLVGKNSRYIKDKRLIGRVEKIFKLRNSYFNTNKIKYLLLALLNSINMNHLYESIIYDYLCVRRKKC